MITPQYLADLMSWGAIAAAPDPPGATILPGLCFSSCWISGSDR